MEGIIIGASCSSQRPDHSLLLLLLQLRLVVAIAVAIADIAANAAIAITAAFITLSFLPTTVLSTFLILNEIVAQARHQPR